MKHKILIVVALMIFTSCMKVKKKEDDAAAPVAQAQQLQSEEQPETRKDRTELEYKYEVNPTTEYHKVHFFAPSNWPSEMIVTKFNGTVQYQVPAQFDRQGEWVDDLVQGQKVNYKFFAKLDKDQKVLAEVEVLPVLDLEIQDADVDLVEHYSINSKTKVIQFRNLKINAQKHLYIEDFSGTIVVDHLSSNDGFIQTFDMDSHAANDHKGKSGGQVNLEIISGEGQLVVVMKGQNGGNGSPALHADKSKNGQDVGRTPGATFDPNYTVSSSGILGSGPITYDCKNPPGAIVKGNDGLQGYPGNKGETGGDSGSIKINNMSNLITIDLHSIFGIGGRLSHGGEGGIGSQGSEAADGGIGDLYYWLKSLKAPEATGYTLEQFKLYFANRLGKSCDPTKAGSPGAHGDPGLDGANDGEHGIIQPSFINSQKIQNPN